MNDLTAATGGESGELFRAGTGGAVVELATGTGPDRASSFERRCVLGVVTAVRPCGRHHHSTPLGPYMVAGLIQYLFAMLLKLTRVEGVEVVHGLIRSCLMNRLGECPDKLPRFATV